MSYSRDEVEGTVRRFIEAFAEADRRCEWSWLADEFYHENAVYTCPYGGTWLVVANGREEIRATHYGRDMKVGWEGWTFPYTGWAVNGDQIITHWMNRGPGTRPDGSFFETHGVSFITYGGGGKFSSQYDLFDIAHQMKLCDELEAAGLLSPQLKSEWVIPTKKRIVDMLAAGG
jgi:hypothetical protein